MPTTPIKIDCAQIPRVQMDSLCRTLLAGVAVHPKSFFARH